VRIRDDRFGPVVDEKVGRRRLIRIARTGAGYRVAEAAEAVARLAEEGI